CALRLFSSRRCLSASARVVGSCADAGMLAPIPIDNIAPVSQLVRFSRCFTFPKPFAQRIASRTPASTDSGPVATSDSTGDSYQIVRQQGVRNHGCGPLPRVKPDTLSLCG